MSFVQLAEAWLHLRVDCTDEDALILLYISAAEQAAINAMDRCVYADSTALQAAIAAAPAALAAATAAKEAAVAAAEALTDADEKAAALKAAENAYLRAKVAYRQACDGIVVNDQMETSSPDVFAVGECVEHRSVCYGLIAPLLDQGKVLAATMTGHKGPDYAGTLQAAKLKIAGVDVFSAGDWGDGDGAEPVRYEDKAMGVYKKVVVRDGRVAGLILVGDTSDSHRYMDWMRANADVTEHRRQLLFPASSSDVGLDVAEMADTATVCGCVGVTKGVIIQAIHEQGVNTMSQLKECTRASTGCGSCSKLCQDLLRAVAPEFEEEAKKVLCSCVPFPEDKLQRSFAVSASSPCRTCLRSTAMAPAARCSSRRSATCSTCSGAAITTRTGRRGSSTIACTPIFRRTARSR